ncbi:hypothetical protein GOB87_12825 [Acetobacter estunensis]|uniref:Metallo-beta-lactamase domain-containing protein n=1 Tax=Acetobacter estunensis TaxID=104097 RepID=A0A967ECN4_9PROT|nr:MBL fold metallo-hydrolase [Acetobacter estunensis]NHO54818.1 hypothetical protein [Acetobacter estunensis]
MVRHPFPLSDHCTGQLFHNTPLPPDWAQAPRPPQWPDDANPEVTIVPGRKRGLRPLPFLRWMLSTLSEQPERIVDPPAPGDVHVPLALGQISVTFIGHDTFLLRLPQPDGHVMTVLTDPIFSERCSPVSFFGPKRFRAPALKLMDLPPIDLILVSHCHYDHLDLPSLRALGRRDNPLVITPIGNGDLIRKAGLKRIVEQDWWESLRFGAIEVTCTPARHFAQRSLFDGGCRLWGGFLLRTRGKPSCSMYFAGDSAHGPHWHDIREQLGAPDVALLPIGAYAPRSALRKVHVDPVEAVAAFRALGARHGVAMHFDTFPLSQEPMGEAQRCLAETLAWAGLAPESFAPLVFGETRVFEV